MDRHTEIKAGYSVYSPKSLKLYDFIVHGVSNRWLWRCPTDRLIELYNRNVTNEHLDIGVATGILLDRASWPSRDPNITLLDPNIHCLEAAGARIARFSPETVEADVFEPLPLETKFQSVSLCYLLHCLPGAMKDKAPAVFKNVSNVMEKGATIFGATLLQGEAPRNFTAKALMNVYNKKGVFSNDQDTFENLKAALEERFCSVSMERLGCAALFEAKLA
ncbi:MAG: methyltransferase type 12 [Geminicoccales bacterium]